MARKKVKEFDPQVGAFRPRNAARFIGVGERTMERLIQTGEVPSVRIGRCRLVRRQALETFLASREVSAAS